MTEIMYNLPDEVLLGLLRGCEVHDNTSEVFINSVKDYAAQAC